ncbi:GAP family protein [Silanimonas sp.]|jgi:hypothetical protein|uniref:GAP family protein n=1 Tax=Silanimonas sp. TaxID=1929290 RepID=UPI0022BD68F3|nr:GAP family protein [Silanimonas sp.]MCZ8063592.1 GAP family protein [Silanimonas sp.]
MEATFFATVVALALVDALNPFTIAAQAYLLGTPKPMPRSIAFLVTTLATYLVAGVLLVAGASAFLIDLRPLLPDVLVAAAALGSGLACLGGAAWLWRSARRGTPLASPKSLGIGATVAFAVLATATDVPTALPYFAAAGMIAGEGGSAPAQVAWLLLYCLIYVAPMVALVALRAFCAARTGGIFASVQCAIDWTFGRVLPLFAAGLGAWLCWTGVRMLLALP